MVRLCGPMLGDWEPPAVSPYAPAWLPPITATCCADSTTPPERDVPYVGPCQGFGTPAREPMHACQAASLLSLRPLLELAADAEPLQWLTVASPPESLTCRPSPGRQVGTYHVRSVYAGAR